MSDLFLGRGEVGEESARFALNGGQLPTQLHHLGSFGVVVWIDARRGGAPFHQTLGGGHIPAKGEQDAGYRIGVKSHREVRSRGKNRRRWVVGGLFTIRPNKAKVGALDETVVDEVISVLVLGGAGAFRFSHGVPLDSQVR